MDAAKRVVKNTGFLYARIIINLVIALYSTRLILDALGVENFGIYNLVAGSIALFGFLNSSMAEASQRFMSFALGEGNYENQNRIFNVSVILHLSIAIIITLLLEILAYFLFKSVLEIPTNRIEVAKLVYHFMVVSTFFTIIKVPYDAVLTAHENMFIIAILGIIQAMIKMGIAVYITFTVYDKLIIYGLLMALLSISIIIITYIYFRIKYKEIRFRFKDKLDRKLFKEMTKFASWTLLNHASYIVTKQGTIIILNIFFGVVVNAAQGIENQVSNQIKGFSKTLLNALNPFIVKKEGEKNRSKMLDASMLGNKISFFILSFFVVPVLVEMPTILDLWLKDVPEYAIIFCRLGLISLLIAFLTETFYIAIGAIGDIKQTTIWESLIFASVLPISYLMFKLGASPEAIYINLIIMTFAISTVRVYFLKKLGGLSIKVFITNIVVRCLSVFIITFSISLVPLFIMEEGLLRLLIILFISSISFFGIMYFIGFNNEEKNLLQRVILSFTKKALGNK